MPTRTYPLTEGQMTFAVDWWAKRLLLNPHWVLQPYSDEDKIRAAFREGLRHILTAKEEEEWLFFYDEAILATDYNVLKPLDTALNMAGLDGNSLIYLPWKVQTILTEDGRVMIAESGYTAPQFRRQLYPQPPSPAISPYMDVMDTMEPAPDRSTSE